VRRAASVSRDAERRIWAEIERQFRAGPVLAFVYRIWAEIERQFRTGPAGAAGPVLAFD
jgi:hypothetical protein